MMRFLPLVLLVACGQDRGFGGQDLGGIQLSDTDAASPGDTDTTSNDTLAGLPSVDNATCDETATGVTPELRLVGGVGTLSVHHIGVDGQCCADWRFDAVVQGSVIDVAYFDASDSTCDCDCSWTLEYTVTDLAPGDWTLTAEGEQAQVKVD